MSEIKRGAVLILQAGDPEISSALAAGALAGRAARLDEAQRKSVEAEIDRQAIARDIKCQGTERALLRVAVGNHKTAADYAMMRFEAEVAYGEPVDNPSPFRRALDKAMVIYAILHEIEEREEKEHETHL